jgi:hypothetical protein
VNRRILPLFRDRQRRYLYVGVIGPARARSWLGEAMQLNQMMLRGALLAVALLFCCAAGWPTAISSAAMAQGGAVNFQIAFTGHVDCHRPFAISGVPISGSGTGTMTTDGNVTADLTETAFVLSTRIHFEGRLGARANPAPGGTAQVRVAGKNRLLLIWNLPNNQMIVGVTVHGSSCSATFEPRLKPGMSEYTLFDGNIYHYCGRPSAETSSCQVH